MNKRGGFLLSTLNTNNKKIINVGEPENNGDAINKMYVDDKLLLKLDKIVSTPDLNMNNKKINNLTIGDKDIKSAANVGYVNNKVHTAKGDVTVGLKNYFDKNINESHISSSTNKKDAFRYLMESVDESSSENNIIVDGIIDFSASPHNVNKKT